MQVAKHHAYDEYSKATILEHEGVFLLDRDELKQAQACFDKALSLFVGLGDRNSEGRIWDHLGLIQDALGNRKEALRCFMQSQSFIKTDDLHGRSINLIHLGNTYLDLGKWQKAEECYQEALQAKENLGDREGIQSLYKHLASLQRRQGNYDIAKTLLSKSLVISRKLLDLHAEAVALGNLGSLYIEMGDFVRAEPYLREALENFLEIDNHRSVGSTLDQLGTVLQAQAKRGEARDCYDNSFMVAEEIQDLEGMGISLHNLGSLARDEGHMPEARGYYLQALDIFQRIGSRHEEGQLKHNLGILAYEQGDFKKAIAFYDEALEIVSERDGVSYIDILNDLAIIYDQLGQWVKAEEYFLRSLQESQEKGYVNKRDATLLNWGAFQHRKGKIAEAEKLFKQVQESSRSQKKIPTEAGAWLNLGVLNADRSDLEEAHRALQKAEALFLEQEDFRSLAGLQVERGSIYLDTQDLKQAERCYQEALSVYQEIGDQIGIAQVTVNLGVIDRRHDNIDAAIEKYHLGLAIFQELGLSLETAQLLSNLAGAYSKTEQRTKAIAMYEKAYALLADMGNIPLREEIENRLTSLREK